MDEHPLAALEVGLHVKVEIGGGEHLRQCRRLHHVQPRRHRQDLPGRHRDALGVASPGQKRAHFIARTDAGHALPGGHNLARALQTQDVARARRGRVASRPLQQVRTVDGGRMHGDQRLAHAGLGVVDLLPA